VPDAYKLRLKKKLEVDSFAQPPTFKNGGILKEYQWEAVRLMCANWSHNRGFILADEVGINGLGYDVSLFTERLPGCFCCSSRWGWERRYNQLHTVSKSFAKTYFSKVPS